MLAGVLALATSSPAGADDTQLANQKLAQSLFERARQLMTAGKYSEACAQFAESQRLDPGDGTLLNLAVCHEKEGRTATAWIEFSDALSRALQNGRKDREQIARERIRVLEPKLSRLSVTVTPGAEVPNMVVTLDGAELRKTAWGIATAVDPGAHKVDAVAPGYQAWSALVIVSDGGDRKEVQIPPLTPAPDRMPPVVVCPPQQYWNGVACLPQPGAEAVPGPPPPPVRYEAPVTRYSSFRYVEGAVTLAALGASAITGALALADHSTFTSKCLPDRGYCTDPSGLDAASNGRTMAWASTITLGAGIVGAIVFLVWPRESSPQTGGGAAAHGGPPGVSVATLPGGAALQLGGTL